MAKHHWRLPGAAGAVFIGLVCLTPSGAAADPAGSARAFSLPPSVPDRIGRAQIFDFHIPDKSVMIGRRDFIWASMGAPVAVYSSAYLAADRDLDKTHNLTWLRASHQRLGETALSSSWGGQSCEH